MAAGCFPPDREKIFPADGEADSSAEYAKKIGKVNEARAMRDVQTSESIKLGIVLAVCGGFMDAYSYIGRGGTFANAVTGNIVLMAIHLEDGNTGMTMHYLVSILAFALGVLLSEVIRHRKENLFVSVHWRQVAVGLEIAAMTAVAFMPQEMNLAANSLISLTCGIQAAAFAKIHGRAMATTMCTGNLRSGTQNLSLYLDTGDKKFLRNSYFYYGCIVCFILGAMLGNSCTRQLAEQAALVVAVLLLAAFIMMFYNREFPSDVGNP